MENNRVLICYSCGNSGHFSKNCPQRSGGNNTKERTANSSTAEFPATHCPCGGGLCLIKVSSKNNRAFYCCPGKYEKRCEHFKWCDGLKPHEILYVQPNPFPICSCAAGICRVETQKCGAYTGRKYFACNIRKGDGACSFRQWQDDYLDSVSVNRDDGTTNDSLMNEINWIYEALENGEIELDFFPSPSPTDNPHTSDASESGYLVSGLTTTECRAENYVLPAFSTESLDEGWWFP